jgi:hypothetical protein
LRTLKAGSKPSSGSEVEGTEEAVAADRVALEGMAVDEGQLAASAVACATAESGDETATTGGMAASE